MVLYAVAKAVCMILREIVLLTVICTVVWLAFRVAWKTISETVF